MSNPDPQIGQTITIRQGTKYTTVKLLALSKGKNGHRLAKIKLPSGECKRIHVNSIISNYKNEED